MLLTAERAWVDGALRRDVALVINRHGRLEAIEPNTNATRPDRHLDRRLVLPGFVNAHSHAFQRLLRGRTQRSSGTRDDFWSWRQAMYAVASSLDPRGLQIAARQAFLEMLLCGVTSVGEFHYLHHQPDGAPYADAVTMTDALAQAALEVGIRLCVLRTVYLRGGFDEALAPHQKRFADPTLDAAMSHTEMMVQRLRSYVDARLAWGVAAHSVRAVPIDAIVGIKTAVAHLPMHIHVSEQKREVDDCLRTHGVTPIALLDEAGVLDAATTLVHATHLRAGEAERIAYGGAAVCVCPTTEADLGDGLVPAGDLFAAGVPLCLGTDGQIGSSVLEEARRLEMHERLRQERRNILVMSGEGSVGPALLEAATRQGARALDLHVGVLEPGRWADLVAFDLDDPSLAGVDDDGLLDAVMLSAEHRAIREVMVGGRWVVEDGQHRLAAHSAHEFNALSTRLFLGPPR